MPNIIESLQGRDLGHLRIIAEFWGFDLVEQDPKEALLQLSSAMLDTAMVEAVIKSMPMAEREAMVELSVNNGRVPWAQFTRRYGSIREMGVAKRDRELPYKQPVSATEALWYKGFLARAFFDTPSGPEEFAYIPDDLLAYIPLEAAADTARMGRQAAVSEYANVTLANDRILDHACTLLAAQRLGISIDKSFYTRSGEELTPHILRSLLATCGLLDASGMPLQEPVRAFLEAGRGEALGQLFRCWRQSNQFNELCLLPNLSFEGNWVNDPLSTRGCIIDYLALLPADTWWSLGSFIAAIKKRDPDFQRPAGDYDTWFIRATDGGDYLCGFEHWDAVEGRLIRFILTGPLHWLGVLDLGSIDESAEITAIRFSRWSQTLLNGESPRGLTAEEESIIVRSDARLSARRLVPRKVRYQLARFCDWVKETPDEYQYQVSPTSLGKARKLGLTVGQLLALLNRYSKAVPPSLVRALERWEKSGSEARLEKVLILKVTSTEVLQALRKSRASRFLGDPLGPTTITIKQGAAQKVLAALAELGYLGEIRSDEEPG